MKGYQIIKIDNNGNAIGYFVWNNDGNHFFSPKSEEATKYVFLPRISAHLVSLARKYPNSSFLIDEV